MAHTQSNAGAIWALGATQIIGYGTLYHSFSILAPSIAADLGVAVEWVYGCISLALLAGGLVSPWAGGLADRIGAGRVMSLGSVGAASALLICGLAQSTIAFLGGMILVELASAFVLYATAFAFLAQTTGANAQRSITYLTLIAGFALTIFWPLTSWLLGAMTGTRSICSLQRSISLSACHSTSGCRASPASRRRDRQRPWPLRRRCASTMPAWSSRSSCWAFRSRA